MCTHANAFSWDDDRDQQCHGAAIDGEEFGTDIDRCSHMSEAGRLGNQLYAPLVFLISVDHDSVEMEEHTETYPGTAYHSG